jgi:hypothetical protein
MKNRYHDVSLQQLYPFDVHGTEFSRSLLLERSPLCNLSNAALSKRKGVVLQTFAARSHIAATLISEFQANLFKPIQNEAAIQKSGQRKKEQNRVCLHCPAQS